ncbi:hypothetical protein DNU06_04030 [Putridiphycobacter roseus]|uniref:Uncharacterized protein n=1 Tax=Putridiphycobacter roseus TaxID=2219161 RepID=A0A2W1NIN0_9FLAO|nr:NirD/YgiW/YdeI family stress tolerance protein [Putridiphycobacter roseus]PZE17796.1 hypothetical protein DNU06_04030 [Putridiphycobacter roseus]
MKTTLKKVSLIILFSTSVAAFAQYTGPNSTNKTLTVLEVKKNAAQLDKSDTNVKLSGYVIEKINKDTYWFQDATGKVLIEIESKYLPTINFDEKTKINIIAEVDYDELEEVELEVEHLEIAL